MNNNSTNEEIDNTKGLNAKRITNIIRTKLKNYREEIHNPNTPKDYNKRAFIDIWQNELDLEFQKANQTNLNFKITPPFNTLYIQEHITNIYDGEKQCEYISRAVTDWWSKAIDKGEPAYLNAVVNVVNDAEKIYEPLYNDILNLRNKGNEYNDGYLRLHETIIKHIKTIIWTVTEVGPDGPKDFYEGVL